MNRTGIRSLMDSGIQAMERFDQSIGRSGGLLLCSVMTAVLSSAPSVLAESQIFQYIGPTGEVVLTDRPQGTAPLQDRPTNHYHRAVSDVELEGAVGRAARAHRLHPALLLAVIKAESSFNPIVVSKAGAVGLMQLIPETAIRHGVQNLYSTDDNITGGAKHLRYLLDRFHGNLRLAIAAYNAGERTIDRYGKIPPYKETRLYVQRVMNYYREYKKGGWVLPIASQNDVAASVRAY